MSAVMVTHIDKFASLFHNLESGLYHRLGTAHKGNHRAVSGLAGVNIQKFHTRGTLDNCRNLIDNSHVAPFAEVGHTFHKSVHF